jgi:uncharacterized protein
MGAKIIHVEVAGKDGEKLQKFYGDVFGWELDTNNPGIGPSQNGGDGHVTFYVSTDDPNATLRKVEEAGGRVIMPLTEVAPETTIALFTDPEGHVIGLM